MLKKNLWKKSRKSRFPFHLKHQELAILKGKYSFTVYFSFTISFVFVFSCRLDIRTNFLFYLDFLQKEFLTLTTRFGHFTYKMISVTRLGNFLDFGQFFKAFGNN